MSRGKSLRKTYRELNEENIISPSQEQVKAYFANEKYETLLVEYTGKLRERLSDLNYADGHIIDESFALLFVNIDMVNQLLESIPEIINIEPNYPYTLSELYLMDSKDYNILEKGTLSLDGEGVIIGIVGTGIDYLNPRFLTENGENRIVAFWDQTIGDGPSPSFYPYGTEYKKTSFDAVLKADFEQIPNGLLPPSDGFFGTAIAGIIGGRKIDNVDKFESIAPKCEFAIVNLKPATEDFFRYLGISESKKGVYETIEIFAAIKYLSEVQQSLKKPMVVYLPLGSNSGGRSGESILERYIDKITKRNDFIVVTNTGNQGDGDTHAGGVIEATGVTENNFIYVDEKENSLYITIYTRVQDIIYTSITSPSGETISRVPIDKLKRLQSYEEQGINIDYFVQEKANGNMNLVMIIRKVKKGLWKIGLFGEQIKNGSYDMWIHQSELLQPNTRFFNSYPIRTLLTPSTAANIISSSYFDNRSNDIGINSGKGYPRVGPVQPVVACQGFQLATVGIGNDLITCSGAAMGRAILTGALALIFQWGIVQGNYPEINTQFLRDLLMESTIQQENINYPNERWGYGRLDFKKLKENL